MDILKIVEVPVSYVLVAFFKFWTFLGMDGASGWTWFLSIVGLVITIRTLLIPLFVRQIRATRAMQMLAPDLKKIQAKYKGKKDQASREAMTRETMALYQKHRTNPFASCLPVLVQAPIFLGLFRVLNTHLSSGKGIGWLSPDLAHLAAESTIFGAGIDESFNGSSDIHVKIVTAVLIAAMILTTFLTQRQLTRKNMPAAALEGQAAQTQKIMMYALPFVFLISGPIFPIGVLVYWTTSNLWTMGQQFYVIRRSPTPGSQAEKALQERRAAKEAKKGGAVVDHEAPAAVIDEPQTRQRNQPQRKNRRKR